MFAILQHRVFRHRVVLFRAKNQADRRVVALARAQVVKHPHVAIHLADIPVAQLADLQIDEQVELQLAVIENQIHIAIILANPQPLLSGDKGKPFAQLQQKRLQIRKDRLLQIRFLQCRHLRQPEKLQHVGILQTLNRGFRARDHPAALRQHLLRVLALQRSLVVEGMNLPFQCAFVPHSCDGFAFIKLAGRRFLHPHQGPIVRPRELRREPGQRFATLRVLNCQLGCCRGHRVRFHAQRAWNSRSRIQQGRFRARGAWNLGAAICVYLIELPKILQRGLRESTSVSRG